MREICSVRGEFHTVKFSIGGGMSSPSTMMWYFSRSLRCSSAERFRTNLGGVHLKNKVRDITRNYKMIGVRCLYGFSVLHALGQL